MKRLKKPGIKTNKVNDISVLQNLVDACNELNQLIVSHAPQGAIDDCEQRKNQALLHVQTQKP